MPHCRLHRTALGKLLMLCNDSDSNGIELAGTLAREAHQGGFAIPMPTITSIDLFKRCRTSYANGCF